MLPHSTSLPSTGSPQPPPTAAAARREFERLASLGRGQRGRPAAPPLRPRPWAGVADPVLPTELEPPLLPDDAPGAGLDGFRDDADTPPDPPPLAPFLPLLVRAAMARWGGESPAATLAARLLQAKWAALRCGAEEAGALDAQLNAALKANAGLAADLDALADAMTEGEGDHPTYPGSEFGSADAVASFRAEEAASARAAAAAAAQGSPYAGLVKVSVLSYRASSSSGGGGGGRRSLFACCVAPPPTLDNNGAPSTFATPAAARFGGSGRRVKPYVHVWLKAGPGESRGDRDARPPARTAAARPLARTATARRGTAATWKDAASPTVAVATPDAVLEVAVRDGSKRRRLAAALAGDPVVGVGVLPLATIVDRAGPAAGPATWTVPIHAPSRGDRGGGSVVNGGGPALLDGAAGSTAATASTGRTLVGVVKLEVHYVADARAATRARALPAAVPASALGGGNENDATPANPAAAFLALYAALDADWRAALVAKAGGGGGDDEGITWPHDTDLPPPPPPPPHTDTDGDDRSSVPELASPPVTAATAAGHLPGGRWAAASRGAAALLRARPHTQAVAALAAAVRACDAAAPAPDAAPAAALVASLWAPLAAAGREGRLTLTEADAIRALAPRAAAAALSAVEAYPWRWSGAAGVDAAGPSVRILALATTWQDDVRGLASMLQVHVRRAARRAARRAVAAAGVAEGGRHGDPSSRETLARAAWVALEAATSAVAVDAALRPAFGGGKGSGLDPVSVAGRVRATAARRLLAAALAPYPDGTAAPYGADAQRAEDAARALGAALSSTAGPSVATGLTTPDIDAAYAPAVDGALWRLRPLAVEWVERTLAPRGGAVPAAAVWRPLSRDLGALYAHAVIDLYTLISSAVEGLGARAVGLPRARGAAAAHARTLASALASAPARAAAMIEEQLVADVGAPAAAAGAASGGVDGEAVPVAAGPASRLPGWLGGGGGRTTTRATAAPRPPPPLSSESCVRLASLFELVTRHADNEAAQAGLLQKRGASADGGASTPARLAPNAELGARLAGAADRGARAVAGRLQRGLAAAFAASPVAVDRVVTLVLDDLETLVDRLPAPAAVALARAAWRGALAAADAALVAASAGAGTPAFSEAATAGVLPATPAAIVDATLALADEMTALRGPAPLPPRSIARGVDRVRSLATLASSPTPSVVDAADALWAAAAERSARARGKSGLGVGVGGDDDGEASGRGFSWSRRSTADGGGALSRSPSPERRGGMPPTALSPRRLPASLTGLSFVDALRVLRSRAAAGDTFAATAAAAATDRATGAVMASVFGVRGADPVLLAALARCSATGGGRGTLYVSERHVAFAREGYGLGDTAAPDTDVSTDPEAGVGVPLAVYPLSDVTRLERGRCRRSRALLLYEGGGARGDGDGGGAADTDAAAPAAVFWEFGGGASRDDVEATVRLHVAGSGSPLDKHLRGQPPPGAPPGTLGDRAFEGRVGGGAFVGAWTTLRLRPDRAVLDSDEGPPMAAPYASFATARVSRAAALAGGGGVALAARWVRVDAPPRPPDAPSPPLITMRLAGVGADGARELVAEVKARCAAVGVGLK